MYQELSIGDEFEIRDEDLLEPIEGDEESYQTCTDLNWI
jgi:hypothetical protein